MVRAVSQGMQMPIYEPDEPAWIYSGYYFNLYFLQHAFFHTDWNDYDAFDHPPLAKYLIGGAFFIQGHRIDSLDAKKTWRTVPISQFADYYRLWIAKVPLNLLPTARFILFLFSFSSLLLFYKFLKDFYGFGAAILATSLLAVNPIFLAYSMQTLAEPVLLFFFKAVCRALVVSKGQRLSLVFDVLLVVIKQFKHEVTPAAQL